MPSALSFLARSVGASCWNLQVDPKWEIEYRMHTDPICVRADGGLGNKLRVLLSHRELARDVGRALVVLWKLDPACPARFCDLFEALSGVTIVYSDAVDLRAALHALGVHETSISGAVHCAPAIAGTERETLMYADLRPSALLATEVASTVASCGTDFIAIHVRRTDLVAQHGISTPDGEFELFLDAHAPRPAYVATDNAATQAHFAEQLGARYRSYATIEAADAPSGAALGSASRRHTSMSHAAVDVLVAVEATLFKGSRGSSFSELIWHLRHVRGKQHSEDELYTGRQLRRLRWRRDKAERARERGGKATRPVSHQTTRETTRGETTRGAKRRDGDGDAATTFEVPRKGAATLTDRANVHPALISSSSALIPQLARVRERLRGSTGWSALAVATTIGVAVVLVAIGIARRRT